MYRSKYRELTLHERQAMRAYKAMMGRCWKQELLKAWQTGDYGTLVHTGLIPTLQNIHNTLGPSWLMDQATRAMKEPIKL